MTPFFFFFFFIYLFIFFLLIFFYSSSCPGEQKVKSSKLDFLQNNKGVGRTPVVSQTAKKNADVQPNVDTYSLYESISQNLEIVAQRLRSQCRQRLSVPAVEDAKVRYVLNQLLRGYLRLPVVQKEVKQGPNGGFYYTNRLGKPVYLKEYQRKQCEEGTLRGSHGACQFGHPRKKSS
jgi:hypothetical protein